MPLLPKLFGRIAKHLLETPGKTRGVFIAREVSDRGDRFFSFE